MLLQQAATPDLYSRNGFRLLELPADARPRDVDRRKLVVEMAFNNGLDIPSGPGRCLPLDPSPDTLAVRDAALRLGDAEKRLVDEFFWFWPGTGGQAAQDAALVALRDGRDREAERLWLEQESESVDGEVSTHNLAVFYHLRALEGELGLLGEGPGSKSQNGLPKLWNKAFRRWAALAVQEGFWKRVNDRIRELQDPRLTLETGDQMRSALPVTLVAISAQVALRALQVGCPDTAGRMVEVIGRSGFAPDAVTAGLRQAVEPVRERIKALCRTAERAAERDPIHADEACLHLLRDAEPLLSGLRLLLPEGDPTRDLAHDDVASQMLTCQVAYAKKTRDWAKSVTLLERASALAVGERVRRSLRENLETVRTNAETNDEFCGVGYFELPAPLFERLEQAHAMAERHDHDAAVAVLRELLEGRGGVGVAPEHLVHVQKALAYCLGCRAVRRLNEAARQRTDDLPSVVRRIVARSRQIDPVTSVCAKAGTIPPGMQCHCMADGHLISGRYMTFTFRDVPMLVCGSCADEMKREQDQQQQGVRDAIAKATLDYVVAADLDPTNQFVQRQITTCRKLCTDFSLPFPSLASARKEVFKGKPASRAARVAPPDAPIPAAPAAATSTAAGTPASTPAQPPWQPFALWSLGLGLASLLFGAFAGIPAVIAGHRALVLIRRSPGASRGKALAGIGLALGYFSLLVAVIPLLSLLSGSK